MKLSIVTEWQARNRMENLWQAWNQKPSGGWAESDTENQPDQIATGMMEWVPAGSGPMKDHMQEIGTQPSKLEVTELREQDKWTNFQS